MPHRSPSGGPAPGPVPRTAGVLLVRDSVDVAPLVVAHHLATGLERVHVIDDGSTDGTSEFLEEIGRRTDRVTHQRLVGGEDDPQLETVSDACNRLVEEGARLVVPFDADEFWDLDHDRLAALVADERPRRLTTAWVNFAQAREHTYPRPMGLLSVRHRAEVDPAADEEAVLGFRASFLQYGPVPKTAVWADGPIQLTRGQHHVELRDAPGALPEEPLGADVLHVPIRWRSELTKRAYNYEPRRARGRSSPNESWQSLFHLQAAREGRFDDVWAASSVDPSGCLDVYGRRVRLTPDDRLRAALLGAGEQLLRLRLRVP